MMPIEIPQICHVENNCLTNLTFPILKVSE